MDRCSKGFSPSPSPSSPRENHGDEPKQLDELLGSAETRELVAWKALRFIKRSGLPRSELDDAIQWLYCALARDGRKYDSNRGCWLPFAERSLQFATNNLIRTRLNDRRRAHKTVSLQVLVRIEGDGELSELSQLISNQELERRTGGRPADPVRQFDLNSDIESFKADLPKDLRVLVDALKLETVLELYRRTDVPRSTIYDRIAQIRKSAENSGLAKYVQ